MAPPSLRARPKKKKNEYPLSLLKIRSFHNVDIIFPASRDDTGTQTERALPNLPPWLNFRHASNRISFRRHKKCRKNTHFYAIESCTIQIKQHWPFQRCLEYSVLYFLVENTGKFISSCARRRNTHWLRFRPISIIHLLFFFFFWNNNNQRQWAFCTQTKTIKSPTVR